MALLERLQPGQVYLVKVSASNQMGDGPFSPTVELALGPDPSSHHAHGPPHNPGQSGVSPPLGPEPYLCYPTCVIRLVQNSELNGE